MSQNPIQPANSEEPNWKSRTYITGAALGTIFGLLSAYLFARAAEENTDSKPPEIPTMKLLGVGLAVLGLARQIAELGKDNKK